MPPYRHTEAKKKPGGKQGVWKSWEIEALFKWPLKKRKYLQKNQKNSIGGHIFWQDLANKLKQREVPYRSAAAYQTRFRIYKRKIPPCIMDSFLHNGNFILNVNIYFSQLN